MGPTGQLWLQIWTLSRCINHHKAIADWTSEDAIHFYQWLHPPFCTQSLQNSTQHKQNSNASSVRMEIAKKYVTRALTTTIWSFISLTLAGRKDKSQLTLDESTEWQKRQDIGKMSDETSPRSRERRGGTATDLDFNKASGLQEITPLCI